MGIGRFHFGDVFCHRSRCAGGYRKTSVRITNDGVFVEHIRSGGDEGFILAIAPEGDFQLLRGIIHIDQFGGNKQRLR